MTDQQGDKIIGIFDDEDLLRKAIMHNDHHGRWEWTRTDEFELNREYIVK